MNKNQWTFGGRTLVSALLLMGVLSIYNLYVKPVEATNQFVQIAHIPATSYPSFETMSLDGNVLVWDFSTAKIYKYSSQSPYTLMLQSTMSSLCAGGVSSMAVNPSNGVLAVGACGYIALFEPNSLGLIGYVNVGVGIQGLAWYTPTNTLYAFEATNKIQPYTVQSGAFTAGAAITTTCGQFAFGTSDLTTYLFGSCVTDGKIYRYDLATGANELSFATTCACSDQLTAELNWDAKDGWIIHAEGTHIRAYTPAGVLSLTITTLGSNLKTPFYANGVIWALDMTNGDIEGFNNDASTNTLAYFSTITGAVTTNKGALVVIGNTNVPVVGVQASGDSSGYVVAYTGSQTAGGGGGTGTCGSPHCYGDQNCDLPQNQNILACKLILTPNSSGFTGTGQMLNQTSTNLVCSVGLITCTFNPTTGQYTASGSIKTNGVGYILVVVGMGILVSMFWLASGGDLRNIPLFVWFISMIGFIGMMVAFGFIDVTFLLVSIIVAIALASAKVIQTLDIGKF